MVVSPGFFRTLQTRLVKGSEFNPATPPDAPLATVINESMARQYFSDQDPLGKRLLMGSREDGDRRRGPGHPAARPRRREDPRVLPLRAARDIGISDAVHEPAGAHLRCRRPRSPRAYAARCAAVDPEQPVADLRDDGGDRRRRRGRPPADDGRCSPASPAVALLLCALGIYGLVAHSVSARRQEIGVRMALGAQRAQVLSVVVRQGFRWVLIGLGVGLAGALAAAFLLSRILTGLLFDGQRPRPALLPGCPDPARRDRPARLLSAGPPGGAGGAGGYVAGGRVRESSRAHSPPDAPLDESCRPPTARHRGQNLKE